MKLLILSDIHANWNALEAVLASESYGGLVFLGDAVDFGPDPGNCVKFLMSSSKHRFWAVRGDHDHGMAYGTNSKCTQELRNISAVSREWGEGYLTSGEVGFLRRLPVVSNFSIDGVDFEMAHGSDRTAALFDMTAITEDGRPRRTAGDLFSWAIHTSRL
jgi:protein phosphatase